MATEWQDGDGNPLSDAELARIKGTQRLFRDPTTNDPMAEYEWTDPDTGTTYNDGPRVATEEEAEALVEQEHEGVRVDTAELLQAVDLASVDTVAELKEQVIRLAVATEQITVQEALDVGWTPPA